MVCPTKVNSIGLMGEGIAAVGVVINLMGAGAAVEREPVTNKR
jgi:hypothetical protein